MPLRLTPERELAAPSQFAPPAELTTKANRPNPTARFFCAKILAASFCSPGHPNEGAFLLSKSDL